MTNSEIIAASESLERELSHALALSRALTFVLRDDSARMMNLPLAFEVAGSVNHATDLLLKIASGLGAFVKEFVQ